jgi:hypothetical protein
MRSQSTSLNLHPAHEQLAYGIDPVHKRQLKAPLSPMPDFAAALASCNGVLVRFRRFTPTQF